ncbi:VOC family protein [Staphylococcus devriesei]|uniref:VOC family protein n=1 Tax=Staphylococcus devriesei TaxID=586733 RepID=UPI000E693E0A|nr:VOC family protein [Staphylococcus devriesei]RIL70646.1 VOC family protein [Staphylococcus devriesei]
MNAFHTTKATQVTNVTLNVEDLNKMTQFYSNILGFSIKEQDNQHTVFNIGTHGHTLTLNYLADGRRQGFREAGLFHIAYLLPTRADLANFLYHASRLNIRVGGGDHLVSEALYLADPEGNGIEVYQDRPNEDWQWGGNYVKMDTLEVDADDLIAQRTEEGWQGWPKDGMIGHLHLKTHDLGQARDFYIEQIGLEHISNYPQALFMSTEKYHHHIATNTWQSSEVRTDNEHTYGLAHFDIYKPGVEETYLTSPEGFDVTIHSDTSVVPG